MKCSVFQWLSNAMFGAFLGYVVYAVIRTIIEVACHG